MKLTNKSTFCIITPTAYLEEFASRSTMHLVLAHLVDADPVYEQFYKNRTELKIMDNGAFELGQSYEPSKLIELGQRCNADVIVLPDYPFKKSDNTIEAAIQWIPKIKESGFKTCFVPQSEEGDLEDWIEAYEWGSMNDDVDVIGMSILGIPNALSHIPKPYARVVMTQILIDRGVFNFEKHHHYLGLQNISLEIPPLVKMGTIDSCDSSNPVWAGIKGYMYNTNSDSFLGIQKRLLGEVNFNEPMCSGYEQNIIHYNIDTALSLFQS